MAFLFMGFFNSEWRSALNFCSQFVLTDITCFCWIWDPRPSSPKASLLVICFVLFSFLFETFPVCPVRPLSWYMGALSSNQLGPLCQVASEKIQFKCAWITWVTGWWGRGDLDLLLKQVGLENSDASFSVSSFRSVQMLSGWAHIWVSSRDVSLSTFWTDLMHLGLLPMPMPMPQ